jgi:hypothetical protein
MRGRVEVTRSTRVGVCRSFGHTCSVAGSTLHDAHRRYQTTCILARAEPDNSVHGDCGIRPGRTCDMAARGVTRVEAAVDEKILCTRRIGGLLWRACLNVSASSWIMSSLLKLNISPNPDSFASKSCMRAARHAHLTKCFSRASVTACNEVLRVLGRATHDSQKTGAPGSFSIRLPARLGNMWSLVTLRRTQ